MTQALKRSTKFGMPNLSVHVLRSLLPLFPPSTLPPVLTLILLPPTAILLSSTNLVHVESCAHGRHSVRIELRLRPSLVLLACRPVIRTHLVRVFVSQDSTLYQSLPRSFLELLSRPETCRLKYPHLRPPLYLVQGVRRPNTKSRSLQR